MLSVSLINPPDVNTLDSVSPLTFSDVDAAAPEADDADDYGSDVRHRSPRLRGGCLRPERDLL